MCIVRGMALTATMYRLQISLSDVDRGVYEALDVRLAKHPSETMRFLLTRALAYCLSYEEGIAFSAGISSTDEPALSIKDLQGNTTAWIEVGSPSADRLHKASKAAPRVAIYTHAEPKLLQKEARTRPIHKVEQIALHAFETSFLDELEKVTDRSAKWELLHNDGNLYVTVGTQVINGTVTKHRLDEPA